MGSKRGRSGPSTPVPAPTPPLGPSTGAPGTLLFQFWDDRKWATYKPEDQEFLAGRFAEEPPPQTVQFPSGKYEIQNFDEVPLGRAVQVNSVTQFERTVRLKPPYELPGSMACRLDATEATGLWFQYFENGWLDYNPSVQHEFRSLAQSSPLPEQVFFTTAGKAYFMFGLDKLCPGREVELSQINAKTGRSRRARALPSTAPSPVPAQVSPAPTTPAWATPAAASLPPVISPSCAAAPAAGMAGGGYPAAVATSSSVAPASSRSRKSGLPKWRPSLPAASPRMAASSSSSAAPVHSPPAFSADTAVFRIGSRPTRGGGDTFEPVHTQASSVLWDAWRQTPRPDKVELPSGDVVEGFSKLEMGHAGCQVGRGRGAWLPLELHVPPPAPGRVQLPEELDLDTTFDMSSCGSYLTDQEVAGLPPTNGTECECPICRCDLKTPDGGDNAESNPSSMCDNAMNPDGVFRLQCGHHYHSQCLEQWFQNKRRCPECQQDFGKVTGDQPRHACMEWHTEQFPLPGHRTKETIVIDFTFPEGVSDDGVHYKGRRPKGYLPGNVQGAILLELFKVAFRRRVMFGLGHSMTTNAYRPTFNIHIKTSTHRGITGHGYPDDDYFQRSLEELRTNGVTMADLQG